MRKESEPLTDEELSYLDKLDDVLPTSRAYVRRAIAEIRERRAAGRAFDNLHHADLGRWCLAWARQGYNVFDLSPDFTAAILLTDARELDVADIRLPFSGMLLMVSEGFAEVRRFALDSMRDVSPAWRASVAHIADEALDGAANPPAPLTADEVAALEWTRHMVKRRRPTFDISGAEQDRYDVALAALDRVIALFGGDR